MPRDALKVLWRVRDAAVTAASRDLAAARAAEAHHAGQLDAHCEATRHEQSGATGSLITAFVEWLPHARRTADGLRLAVQTEQARVSRLQQALVLRRTEAEAVAKAMARRDEAAGLVMARQDQAAMDEAAGRRSGGMR